MMREYPGNLNVAKALGRLGQHADKIFIPMMIEEDPRFRRLAFEGLRSMGGSGRSAIPHLLAICLDKENRDSGAAARALAHMMPDSMDATLKAF